MKGPNVAQHNVVSYYKHIICPLSNLAFSRSKFWIATVCIVLMYMALHVYTTINCKQKGYI